MNEFIYRILVILIGKYYTVLYINILYLYTSYSNQIILVDCIYITLYL